MAQDRWHFRIRTGDLLVRSRTPCRYPMHIAPLENNFQRKVQHTSDKERAQDRRHGRIRTRDLLVPSRTSCRYATSRRWNTTSKDLEKSNIPLTGSRQLSNAGWRLRRQLTPGLPQ
ncbi:hypothetical protein Bbelb_085450 [Branchiostoma belcheri]|nr:hypothetical protein Bbelb_085450 [Branchiostoma belcheri]